MTPLELLWNGWRGDYVTTAGSAKADDGSSIFTRILRSGLSDDEANIVHRGTEVFAILNAFPYICGHTLVLPMRQVSSIEELTATEHAELWATVTDAVHAVKGAYLPGGVNVGINLGAAAGGSINEHLHVHVLPRWAGDGNFMTSVANARTLPEALDVSAAKLRSAWPGCATL